MEVDCVRSQWSKKVTSRMKINTQNSVWVPRSILSECDLMLRNTHALSEKQEYSNFSEVQCKRHYPLRENVIKGFLSSEKATEWKGMKSGRKYLCISKLYSKLENENVSLQDEEKETDDQSQPTRLFISQETPQSALCQSAESERFF